MPEQWTIEKIKAARAQLEAPEEELYHADEFVAESHNMIDFLLARIEELEGKLREARADSSKAIAFESPVGPPRGKSKEDRLKFWEEQHES